MAVRLETSDSPRARGDLACGAIRSCSLWGGIPAVEFEKRAQTTGGVLKRSTSASAGIITSGGVVFLFASLGHAQQTDFTVGANAVLSSTYNTASQPYLPPAATGGS